MKGWLLGFACGFSLAFLIPVISPEAGRETTKLQRQLGIGQPDEPIVPVRGPREGDRVLRGPSTVAPSELAPLLEKPVDPITTGSAGAPNVISESSNVPISSGPVPMPRKKPSHIGSR